MYIGYRRRDKNSTNVVIQDVPKEARKLMPPCNKTKFCQTRQCGSITEDDRRRLFEAFWRAMQWDEKKRFLSSLVIQETPKRQSATPKNPKKKRVASYTYHLLVNMKLLPVCQTMFLNTFGLKNSTLRHWLEDRNKRIRPDGNLNEPTPEGGLEEE
uniref:Uncharacterized protein n=1 Tax=Lygus hesperus TaxID=30085 RepID=A0A146L9H4_LYGHE